MLIRPYQPEDDPQLIALERQSPRGFPHPFVHFRRRFIDRAELYDQHYTLVAEQEGELIGVSSIILKDTIIGGQPFKVAYSFDSRVSPHYRRNGVGHAMIEEKLAWAKAQGAIGAYSLIVATNQASMGMVIKAGYEKIRMILYLKFQPYPLIIPSDNIPSCSNNPIDETCIYEHFQTRDLFVPHLAERVQHLDFCRWHLQGQNGDCVGLSTFDQSKIYIQVPADDAWPRSESEIERLGRNLQIFDVVGMDKPTLLHDLFQTMRDEAVSSRVNKITWLVDRAEPIPAFVFDEVHEQMDYWLMYRSFIPEPVPNWHGLVYLDPRDL